MSEDLSVVCELAFMYPALFASFLTFYTLLNLPEHKLFEFTYDK